MSNGGLISVTHPSGIDYRKLVLDKTNRSVFFKVDETVGNMQIKL